MLASDKKSERMEADPIESQHEAELLAEFERRRRARTLTLPTDDVQVSFSSELWRIECFWTVLWCYQVESGDSRVETSGRMGAENGRKF